MNRPENRARGFQMEFLLLAAAIFSTMGVVIGIATSLDDEGVFAGGVAAALLVVALWAGYAQVREMTERLEAYEAAEAATVVPPHNQEES